LFRRKALKEIPQGTALPKVSKRVKALTAAPANAANAANAAKVNVVKCVKGPDVTTVYTAPRQIIGESVCINLPRITEHPSRSAPRAEVAGIIPPQPHARPTPTSEFFNSVSSLFPGVKTTPPKIVSKEVAAPALPVEEPPPGSRAARLKRFVAEFF
jgi:hypothetical protein